MALSTGSKILVNDISTALAGKQDTLGYTPVKSVNGTLADSAGNVSVSATTESFGNAVAYCKSNVNGNTETYRLTVSSGGSSNISGWTCKYYRVTLPAGGTWIIDKGSGIWIGDSVLPPASGTFLSGGSTQNVYYSINNRRWSKFNL